MSEPKNTNEQKPIQANGDEPTQSLYQLLILTLTTDKTTALLAKRAKMIFNIMENWVYLYGKWPTIKITLCIVIRPSMLNEWW